MRCNGKIVQITAGKIYNVDSIDIFESRMLLGTKESLLSKREAGDNLDMRVMPATSNFYRKANSIHG